MAGVAGANIGVEVAGRSIGVGDIGRSLPETWAKNILEQSGKQQASENQQTSDGGSVGLPGGAPYSAGVFPSMAVSQTSETEAPGLTLIPSNIFSTRWGNMEGVVGGQPADTVDGREYSPGVSAYEQPRQAAAQQQEGGDRREQPIAQEAPEFIPREMRTKTASSTDWGNAMAPATQAEVTEAKAAEQNRRRLDRGNDLSPVEQNSREEIMKAGASAAPSPKSKLSHRNRRFKKSTELLRAKIKDKILHGKAFNGNAFYEVAVSDASVPSYCVSLGTDNLIEALREPNSYLLALINSRFDRTGNYFETAEELIADPMKLRDAVNAARIEVVVEKTPVNVRNSIQVRTLTCEIGRGARMHPTQMKAFNADFDGDNIIVNLDQNALGRYPRAMEQLVDAEGVPTIDEDFFPIDALSEDQKKSADDIFLMAFANKDILGMDSEVCNRLSSLYTKLVDDGDWAAFLRGIDAIAASKYPKPGQGRNAYSSALLDVAYEVSADRRALSLSRQYDWLSDADQVYSGRPLEPFAQVCVDEINRIARGGRIPSQMEFYRMYNKEWGDTERIIKPGEKSGKSIPYRTVADIGKAVNRTELISIGSPIEGFNDKGLAEEGAEVDLFYVWQFTCMAGLSREISNRVCMGSRELAVSVQVRKRMLESDECKLPDWSMYPDKESQNRAFVEWLKAFKRMYNIQQRVLAFSQIDIMEGFSIDRGESYRFDGIGDGAEAAKDLATAIIKVYGSYPVSRIFPPALFKSMSEDSKNGMIRDIYGDYTLEEFSMNNRVVLREEGGTAKFKAIQQRLQRGYRSDADISHCPEDVALLVADHKTAQCGRYGQDWMKTTAIQFEMIKNGLKYKNKGDLLEYFDNVSEFIYLATPEMFEHFGMVSPESWENNPWGQKLMAAEDVSAYRSILMSMMIEYRLSRASSILQEQQIVSDMGSTGFLLDGELDMFDAKMDELDASYALELETLSSSSMIWAAIVKESSIGDITYKAFLDNDPDLLKYSKAKAYWESGDVRRYAQRKNERTGDVEEGTFLDFLKSDAPYEMKAAVLADVARQNQSYSNLSSDTMIGQLAYHPDRLYAGSRFDMDKGLKTDTDALKESAKRLSSYKSETPVAIKMEAATFLSAFDENSIESAIKELAEHPWRAVVVSPTLAVDALVSVFDKTYANTEKIQQQPQVNGYFGCVSMQRSGGYYTHLHMTDNAVVNSAGFDQLTPMDVLNILADPELELTIYDEFGTPDTISRESLCGDLSNASLMRFLKTNPRIALMCRKMFADVSSGKDGRASVHSVTDTLDSNWLVDGPAYDVFSVLNDRPRFLSMGLLLTKSDLRLGRNMHKDVENTINWLCRFISTEVSKGVDVETMMEDFEKETGFSREAAKNARLSRRFKVDDLPVEELESDVIAVENLYAEIKAELADCYTIVARNGLGQSMWIKDKPKSLGIDESSMIAYYDAKAELLGARTATMIGVEGSETKKNLVLKAYLGLRNTDKWTMSGDGVVRIDEANPSVSDQSLVGKTSMAISSVAKYLEAKREKGAETYNAKTKKWGDDGTNSIVKFIRGAKRDLLMRFGVNQSIDGINGSWSIEDGMDVRRHVEQADSRDEAVAILANALIAADSRLGYDEDVVFQESDYYNRADFMIGENSDGSFAIRTIEQISAAFRNRISDEAVASSDPETIANELDQILDVLGTDRDPIAKANNPEEVRYRCIYNIKIRNPKKRISRAMRPRSSSDERTYTLENALIKRLDRAVRENNPNWTIPSNKQLRKMSTDNFSLLNRSNKEFAKKLDELVFRSNKRRWDSLAKDWVRDEAGNIIERENGDRRYLYDLVGVYSKNIVIVPGPQSVVAFATSKNGSFDKASFENSLAICEHYGMTAMLDYKMAMNLPEKYQAYAKDLIQVNDGVYMLPFFDIILNGAEGTMVAPAPVEIPVSPDNFVVNAETATFEFREGDATYHMTKELIDRIRINFTKPLSFAMDQLFPNTIKHFGRNSRYEMSFASVEEIERFIINAEWNPETLCMEGIGDDAVVIDLGLYDGTDGLTREAERFGMRIGDYKAAFSKDLENGVLQSSRNDSIIGFAKVVVNHGGRSGGIVFAPIWSFNLEQSGSVPTRYDVENLDYDPSTNSFTGSARYKGGLQDGAYIKAFEGAGASNKMIASAEPVRSRSLDNGVAVDGFYSSSSVSGRFFPQNKRIATMISVLLMARIDPGCAYNLMDSQGAFPGNVPPTIRRQPTPDFPEGEEIDIRSAMASCSLGITDWKLISEAGIRYHSDREINSLIKFWVDRCLEYGTVNPNILLATRSDRGMLQTRITEFEAFLDPGYIFQDTFLKFLHSMRPNLVPDSIEGDARGCLFKPRTDGQEPYGTLQMAVPHRDPFGRWYKALENVFISTGFFGDEFSGFKKVNTNAYNKSVDSLNVGRNLGDFDLGQIVAFGRSGIANSSGMQMNSLTVGLEEESEE